MEVKEKLGDVIDYDGKRAKVKLTGNLEEGDSVRIEGERTAFEQTVDSLEKDKDNQYVWIDVRGEVEKGDMLMRVYEGDAIRAEVEGEIKKRGRCV